MKATLFALFVGLLMVGCGEDIVDGLKLEDRNGVTYLQNEETPFTGRARIFNENGLIEEKNFKDGKQDGLTTHWYENGQKCSERNYKDNKLMSTVVWKPNGEKCPVTNFKDGNGSQVLYKEDGTEYYRFVFKDGKLVTN